MKKHWKKRRAMPLVQRRCAQVISTRWFRTQEPDLRRYFSEVYNDYNSGRADVMASLSEAVIRKVSEIKTYITDMTNGNWHCGDLNEFIETALSCCFV